MKKTLYILAAVVGGYILYKKFVAKSYPHAQQQLSIPPRPAPIYSAAYGRYIAPTYNAALGRWVYTA